MEGSPQIRDHLIDTESEMDDISSEKTPTDDQYFLLYFIMGTYFGPDLKGETPQKSVFQRRAENLPQYSLDKLANSCIKTVEIERIYYYILRKADRSLIVNLPWLHQFFHGNLSSNSTLPFPHFDDLFPPHLHPRSIFKNQYEIINNIVFINDPKILYIKPEYIERFKRLTRLQDLLLDTNDKVLHNIDVQESEFLEELRPTFSSDCLENETKMGNLKEFGSEMIFFRSHPTKEEWVNILSATKSGCALTGSAAMGQIGPILGRVDIGECEDSYLFRVSLPGVKRDEREFSCEVEDDGKVSIRGVTVTGEKTVCRYNQIFEMQSQILCPPGHFSISFKLPGPVDPQQFSGNFGTDGILEGIVMKQRKKRI